MLLSREARGRQRRPLRPVHVAGLRCHEIDQQVAERLLRCTRAECVAGAFHNHMLNEAAHFRAAKRGLRVQLKVREARVPTAEDEQAPDPTAGDRTQILCQAVG